MVEKAYSLTQICNMLQKANLGEGSEYARTVSDGSYRRSMGVNRTVVTRTEKDPWGARPTDKRIALRD